MTTTNNYGLQAVTPNQIATMALTCIKAGLTPYFEGPPGCGKTTQGKILHKMIAAWRGLTPVDGPPQNEGEYGYMTLTLSNMESIDMALPYTYEDDQGIMRQGRALLGILPQRGPMLVVKDEVAQAPDLFKSIAQLLDGRLSGESYVVPEGIDWCLFSNRASDRAGAHTLFTHLMNRIVRMEVKPDLNDFLEHMGEALQPELSGTLSWFPELLDTFDPKQDSAFGSLRSWKMVNDLVASLDGSGVGRDEAPIVYGLVGEYAAAEFLSVCRLRNDLPDVDTILAGGEGAREALLPVQNNPALSCALSIVLTKRMLRGDDIFAKAVQVMGWIGDERAVAFVRTSVKTVPSLLEHPAYGAFVTSHSQYFF